jgi:hypothetical protein
VKSPIDQLPLTAPFEEHPEVFGIIVDGDGLHLCAALVYPEGDESF